MKLTDEQIKEMAIRRGCIEGTAEYYGFIEGAQQARRVLLNPTWRKFSEELPDEGCEVFVKNAAGHIHIVYVSKSTLNCMKESVLYADRTWLMKPTFLDTLYD